MLSKKYYRLGGICGIAALIATFALTATIDPSGNRSLMTNILSWVIGLGSIVLMVAVYQRCRADAPTLSLLAVIVGIGGSWTAPNDPANLPAIMGTYLGFVLFYIVWIAQTSVVLLKSPE